MCAVVNSAGVRTSRRGGGSSEVRRSRRSFELTLMADVVPIDVSLAVGSKAADQCSRNRRSPRRYPRQGRGTDFESAWIKGGPWLDVVARKRRSARILLAGLHGDRQSVLGRGDGARREVGERAR